MANTGKAGLKLGRGEREKRVGGGIRRFSISDGWKIHRKSIEICFGHAMAIGDVNVERTLVERTFVERTVFKVKGAVRLLWGMRGSLV